MFRKRLTSVIIISEGGHFVKGVCLFFSCAPCWRHSLLTSGERTGLPSARLSIVCAPAIIPRTSCKLFGAEFTICSGSPALASLTLRRRRAAVALHRSHLRHRAAVYASPALFCRSRGIFGVSVPISELRALTLAGRFAPSCPRSGYKRPPPPCFCMAVK